MANKFLDEVRERWNIKPPYANGAEELAVQDIQRLLRIVDKFRARIIYDSCDSCYYKNGENDCKAVAGCMNLLTTTEARNEITEEAVMEGNIRSISGKAGYQRPG